MVRLFCIHDNDEQLKRKGAFEITKEQVKEFNKLGYGIFMLVNEFEGKRQAKNCTKINFWLADIDEGSKEDMLTNIKNLALKPSIIVESFKGFHCYWKAENATIENYKEIEQGIIKKLNADKHCTDVSRLLRFPTAYHMKNPKEPFLIKIIEQNNKSYTEEKMLCAFELPKPILKKVQYDGEAKDFLNEANWDKIFKYSLIGEGSRNGTLAKYLLWLRDLNFANNEINYIINGLNQKILKPLPQYEIDIMLKSKGVY